MNFDWQGAVGILSVLCTIFMSIAAVYFLPRWRKVREQANTSQVVAETAKTKAEAAKTEAETAKSAADAVVAQIGSYQSGFEFINNRLQWAEKKLLELQQELQQGWDTTQQLEADKRDCEARAIAWRVYAQGLEQGLKIVPGSKQVYARVKFLGIERPDEPGAEPDNKETS